MQQHDARLFTRSQCACERALPEPYNSDPPTHGTQNGHAGRNIARAERLVARNEKYWQATSKVTTKQRRSKLNNTSERTSY